MESALVGPILLWLAIGLGALGSIPWLRWARALAALAATASVVVLAAALVTNDFTLAYVVRTSSLATPWAYRLAALWGGMEGSMLFYAALTAVVAWIGLGRHPAAPVGSVVATGLLLFTALFASPFERLDIPAVDGRGLLALLQHPAMIYHPPLLYLGLTATVVPFAIAVRAAFRRQSGPEWLPRARQGLLVSWVLLTIGMVAGANWAYVELGWGGFWAWDPVENTALMPWLATTVFLHTSRIHGRDGRVRRWSVLFAAAPFVLTVLGIYLTRSGSTGSIHSFAEDPVIGRLLLGGAIVVALVVAVLVVRTPRGEPWERVGLGRDTWLFTSGLLLSIALVFVTVGSGYPAYVSVFAGRDATVGPGFFVTTIYPMAVVAALLLGPALSTRWSGVSFQKKDLVIPLAASLLVGGLATLIAGWRPVPVALLAVSAGAGVDVVRLLGRNRPRGRSLGSHLAHLGLAMVLIGAAGSAMGADFEGAMAPGDEVVVGGVEVRLDGISTGEDDRFIFVRADFDVSGRAAHAEIRAYEEQTVPVAEPTLVTSPVRDVVLAISTVNRNGSEVEVQVFVRPMVWWVWAGALVLALGGLGALGGRASDAATRHRPATGEQLSGQTTT